ncbi:MAG: LemA family protein [Patescibacteria group bacterium]
MSTTTILLILAGLAIVYLVVVYNAFVVLKARIEEAFSGIDVQLKRRTDLIPNLVSTVKGYAKHEKSVFENVTKARAGLMKAQSIDEKASANNMLTETLKSLFAVAENYPDLKASTNFQDLQRQLEDTEDKIAYSRQFYNSNVLEFNTKVKSFPSNIVANWFKFVAQPYFETPEAEKANVKVDFSS